MRNAWNGQDEQPLRGDASGVLELGVAGRGGHAELLVALCTDAGFQAVKVKGHCKLYGAIDTEPYVKASEKSGGVDRVESDAVLPPHKLNEHAWVAVWLDGQWWLMDPLFAAGHFEEDVNPHAESNLELVTCKSGGPNVACKFVPHFDEHYWLTSPEHFVQDHLPHDESFQVRRVEGGGGGVV